MMLTNSLSKGQIAFLAVVILIVLIAIFLIIYIPSRAKFKAKQFKYNFYKKIYQIAFDEDFYLINDFVFSLDNNQKAKVDHILFGNKYIYLISDYYYEGSLSGNDEEQELYLDSFKGERFITDNPIKESQKLAKRISFTTGVSIDYIVGIVLVNDECELDIRQTYKTHYIIQRKDLKALIKSIESRNVNNFVANQLQETVNYFDKINEKTRQ